MTAAESARDRAARAAWQAGRAWEVPPEGCDGLDFWRAVVDAVLAGYQGEPGEPDFQTQFVADVEEMTAGGPIDTSDYDYPHIPGQNVCTELKGQEE